MENLITNANYEYKDLFCSLYYIFNEAQKARMQYTIDQFMLHLGLIHSKKAARCDSFYY